MKRSRWFAMFITPGKAVSSTLPSDEMETRFAKSEILHSEIFEESRNEQRGKFLEADIAQWVEDRSRNEQFQNSRAAVDERFNTDELDRRKLFMVEENRREDAFRSIEAERNGSFKERELIREETFRKAHEIWREHAERNAGRRNEHMMHGNRVRDEVIAKLERDMSDQLNILLHFMEESFASAEEKRNHIVEKIVAKKAQKLSDRNNKSDDNKMMVPPVRGNPHGYQNNAIHQNAQDEPSPHVQDVESENENAESSGEASEGRPDVIRDLEGELEGSWRTISPYDGFASDSEGFDDHVNPELPNDVNPEDRSKQVPSLQNSEALNANDVSNSPKIEPMIPVTLKSSNSNKDSIGYLYGDQITSHTSMEKRNKHPNAVVSSTYEKVNYESSSTKSRCSLRNVATLPYTQTIPPQPDSYQTRFEKAEKQREEIFKKDEADRDASFEQAEAERGESEEKRRARFEEDTRIRDEVYSAAKAHRDSSYEQAELGRGNREQWRELQFDDAQERRASSFQHSQLWDEKQDTTVNAFQDAAVEICKTRVEKLYEAQQSLLDQARQERSAAFSQHQTRREDQLGVEHIREPVPWYGSKPRPYTYPDAIYPTYSNGAQPQIVVMPSPRRRSYSLSEPSLREPSLLESSLLEASLSEASSSEQLPLGFDPQVLLVRPHVFTPLPVPGEAQQKAKKAVLRKDFLYMHRRRQYLFDKAQAERTQRFEQGMGRRQQIFNDADRLRQKAFEKEQMARSEQANAKESARAREFQEEQRRRERTFRNKESEREENFRSAEKRREQNFRVAQSTRDNMFYRLQETLQTKCFEAEGLRCTAFNKWERNKREALGQRNQSVRADFASEEERREDMFKKIINRVVYDSD